MLVTFLSAGASSADARDTIKVGTATQTAKMISRRVVEMSLMVSVLLKADSSVHGRPIAWT
jgi:hypothetical protein